MRNLLRDLKIFIRSIAVLINKPPAHLPPHCCNINAMLLHLCDYDLELHKWVLRWIAYPLRHPGVKMSTCLVFNGGDEAGKSTFFERVIAGVYGSLARRIHVSELSNVVNSWVVGARMVIVQGGYARSLTPLLKHLVTTSRLWVNERNKPERMEANQMNIVFLSDAIDFLPLSASDRRFMVIEVPPAQSPTFYRAVDSEIQNGGIEAFQHYLLRELDMGDFNERTPAPPPLVMPAQRAAA